MGFGKIIREIARGQSVGSAIGDAFKNKFPISGGLAGMIAGEGGNKDTVVSPTVNIPAPLPDMETPDYSTLLGMNAKPKSSGIADIAKMFFGA